MIKPRFLSLIIAIIPFLLISSSQLFLSTEAQFGVGGADKKDVKNQIPNDLLAQELKHRTSSQGVEADGKQQQGDVEFLSAEDAADMEAIILKAMEDPETMEMVAKFKADMGDEIVELKKLSQEEILGGMKETLGNMKMIEILFKDKDRAFKEMEKEGMIEPSHREAYKKNPELLEEDTRKGLYFQFVSLSVVGGFL